MIFYENLMTKFIPNYIDLINKNYDHLKKKKKLIEKYDC